MGWVVAGPRVWLRLLPGSCLEKHVPSFFLSSSFLSFPSSFFSLSVFSSPVDVSTYKYDSSDGMRGAVGGWGGMGFINACVTF